MTRNPYQHIDLRVNDLQRAWDFYSQILPAIGFHVGHEGKVYSGFDNGGEAPEQAWFGFTIDEDHVANRNRIAFCAESRKKVDEIGEVITKAGALNISGPRSCTEYSPSYYAVFFEDPFGNCLEVCYHEG